MDSSSKYWTSVHNEIDWEINLKVYWSFSRRRKSNNIRAFSNKIKEEGELKITIVGKKWQFWVKPHPQLHYKLTSVFSNNRISCICVFTWFFWDRVSLLCSSGSPETHSVDKVGLVLRDPLACFLKAKTKGACQHAQLGNRRLKPGGGRLQLSLLGSSARPALWRHWVLGSHNHLEALWRLLSWHEHLSYLVLASLLILSYQ